MSRILVPANEVGIFANNKAIIRISFLDVIKLFEKQYFHVIKNIENFNCSEEFNQSNFGLVK